MSSVLNAQPAARMRWNRSIPSIFLTAGHCTDGAVTAGVWFQQDAGADNNPETGEPASSGYPDVCAVGTLGALCATSDELYDWGFDDFASFPDTKDVGLVILDLRGCGSFRRRLMAEGQIMNLRSRNNAGFNVQTIGNGKGRGGTCSGDSGGPIFLGGCESNLIVAVTSFGLNAIAVESTSPTAWFGGCPAVDPRHGGLLLRSGRGRSQCDRLTHLTRPPRCGDRFVCLAEWRDEYRLGLARARRTPETALKEGWPRQARHSWPPPRASQEAPGRRIGHGPEGAASRSDAAPSEPWVQLAPRCFLNGPVIA